jgi:hypothetical protein
MIFDFCDMDYVVKKMIGDKNTYCGCGFCNYEEQKQGVQHLKLFEKGSSNEYYLNINWKERKIELVQR